jgi:hypothetical protein
MEQVIVERLRSFEDDWHFSHAVKAAGLILLSGVTATPP